MTERRIPTASERQDAWRAAALFACDRTPAGRLACTQGFVLTHAQARALAVTDSDIRRWVRRGEWTAPRRGALCVLPAGRDRFDQRPHGARPEVLAAAAVLVRRDAVISHECAALGHGLDVFSVPPHATLTTCGRRFSGARSGAVIRAAWLSDDDVGRWFGVGITTCARTVIDLARRGPQHGIVAIESALHNGSVTKAELEMVIDRQRRWDGVITARQVLELAGDKSESPLESLVRLFLAEHRLPLPEQQVVIDTYRGSYRVDGLWPDRRVVLEVDGLLKYRGDVENPLVEEKLRQEAIERAGYKVVRITWSDIHDTPLLTVARIRAALY
jgi:very-short-patch-repair endonuclease